MSYLEMHLCPLATCLQESILGQNIPKDHLACASACQLGINILDKIRAEVYREKRKKRVKIIIWVITG